MIVWRVEDAAGLGPWWSRNEVSFAIEVDTAIHPTPREDHIDLFSSYRDGWVFGCPSFMILHSWFGKLKTIEQMRPHGYKIVCYDVPEQTADDYFYIIGKSERQVLFDKFHSQLVAEYPIDTLRSTEFMMEQMGETA